MLYFCRKNSKSKSKRTHLMKRQKENNQACGAHVSVQWIQAYK